MGKGRKQAWAQEEMPPLLLGSLQARRDKSKEMRSWLSGFWGI